ncbi:MAG: hypothetical protein AB7O74_15305 [Candidatus Nanopelagicales bacterium]
MSIVMTSGGDGGGAHDRVQHAQSPWTEAAHTRWVSAGQPDLIYHANLDPDLDWLPPIHARGVTVVGTIDDDTAVARCTTIERLTLNTDCSLQLDLSGLPKLNAFGGVDRFLRSAHLPPSVQHLDLRRWKRQDLADVAHLNALATLTLQSRRLRSLSGIEGLRLSRLTLMDARLLANIESLGSQSATLTRLDLIGCRSLHELEQLGRLHSLEILILRHCGKLESLAPLLSIPTLQVLAVDGDTEIADGDIASMATKPGLRWMTVENFAKSYNFTRSRLPRDSTVNFD